MLIDDKVVGAFDDAAYEFVQAALLDCVRSLPRPRHLSGQELLEGIRCYALREYGAMAFRVLSEWGVSECYDFGVIVFELIDRGVFGKQPQDSLDDFRGGYEFDDAFVNPFLIKEAR